MTFPEQVAGHRIPTTDQTGIAHTVDGEESGLRTVGRGLGEGGRELDGATRVLLQNLTPQDVTGLGYKACHDVLGGGGQEEFIGEAREVSGLHFADVLLVPGGNWNIG